MDTRLIFIVSTLWCSYIGLSDARVSIEVKSLNVTLQNELFSASFNSSAVATSVLINGENIVANASGIVGDKGAHMSFFVDFHNGTEYFFLPDSLKVLNQTEEFAHIVYSQGCTDAVALEVHYIIMSGVRGLYQYVVARNRGSNGTYSLAELRVVCRFNPQLMHYINNGKIQMYVPTYEELANYKSVQDETWLMPDGTYYSKYDLAGYMRERNYWGVLGGGYGAWLIHPSHEYFSGGPLKQDIIGHQDSLMIVYMTGAHFGTPGLTMPPGFSKLYGPWLIYFNTGSQDEVVVDVQKQAQAEVGKWPYNFVEDDRYPLARGQVTGTVNGAKSTVILSPPGEAFDQQVHGYSYNTDTVDGQYTLENVRPGNYILSVYPIEGASAGTLLQLNVTVTAGQTTKAETLTMVEPSNILWQIGETNRRSNEFKYGTENRNFKWQFLPPANLTFVVGKSNYSENWYYAQTAAGSWDVIFDDSKDGANRTLLLSIAGASSSHINQSSHPKLTIYLNDQPIQSYTYESDHAIYRSAMQSAVYHFEKVNMPANLVVTGRNKLSVRLVNGSFMHDCLVYTKA